ncbi:PapD-like protein [Flagelloscypha sp. PMI_526]|nr:PapD-like protein [Flagelloscypha sp. PMI_526]
MSVSLNPSSSLGFPRPLTRLVKRDLAISNHNAQPVAFKVKTTAPKLYCVRPNSGRVEPGDTVVVSVMLQALKEEPPLGAKCKDKFLIQSTTITPDKDLLGLTELWASPDTEGKISQQKLRVIYQAAEGQTLEEEDESQVNMSSIMSTNDGRYDTVRQAPTNGSHDTSIPEFNEQRSASPEYTPAVVDEPTAAAPAAQPAPPAVNVMPPPMPEETHAIPARFAAAAPVVSPPAPVTAPAPALVQPNIELQQKLSEASAEIGRLRELLAKVPPTDAQPELRRRTKALSDDGSVADTDVGTIVEEIVQPEGVPLQVVVIIALGVFITTYLFF